MNDVILNKATQLKKCLSRIQEEYIGEEENFLTDLTKQDAIVLNLQRACEVAIDMANHVVRIKQLGLPQTSRDAFDLLEKAGLISTELSHKLQSMVGFRNVAVRDYQRLNLDIVKNIVEKNLHEFELFSKQILKITTEGAI